MPAANGRFGVMAAVAPQKRQFWLLVLSIFVFLAGIIGFIFSLLFQKIIVILQLKNVCDNS